MLLRKFYKWHVYGIFVLNATYAFKFYFYLVVKSLIYQCNFNCSILMIVLLCNIFAVMYYSFTLFNFY